MALNLNPNAMSAFSKIIKASGEKKITDIKEKKKMSQGSGSRNTWKLCECGGAIKRWTSRTDSNPRRRFEACENNRVSHFV